MTSTVRLVRARSQERFACEGVYCLADLGTGDVQAGDADPAVLGDAQDAQVEQGVVEAQAEGQGVRDLVGALLAVSADVSRLDRYGVVAERAVEAAHRALVGVGAQDLFGESAAARPQERTVRETRPVPARSRAGTSRSTTSWATWSSQLVSSVVASGKLI